MGISLKHGLVRVSAFAVVGIAIVVSTQILRGQDPTESVDRVVQMLRNAALRALQDTNAKPDVQIAVADLTVSAAPVIEPIAKVTTFASAAVRPAKSEVPAQCAKQETSAASIVIGDRIQLRFFAKVGMPVQGAAQPAIESVAFERLDLSGTYEIGEDGTTALPLIGRLGVAGQDLTCLEAIIANAIAAEDSTVSAVTATYSARLPVTVSGAVRAPGTYVYAPGMTVNRLINQAGATFVDSPITPQEYGTLMAQRNELQRRQILAALALGRVKANISGAHEIDINTNVIADSPIDLLSPLLAAETAALQQDLAVDQMTAARSTAAIAGLSQKLADTRKQLTLVDTQVAILQERLDQMQALKTRGLLQASNPDVAVSSLMELNRIKLQLETDQSNLSSQIDLAEKDERLAVQLSKQGYAQQATQLSGEISLLDIQRTAIESRLETHGFSSIGNATQGLVISVQRPETNGTYRFDATLDTQLRPGDMVSVLLPEITADTQVTAENAVTNMAVANETDPAQQ